VRGGEFVKRLLFFIWQLPQHLLALVILILLRFAGRITKVQKDDTLPGNVFITVKVQGWGVSLGRYIFLDEAYGEDSRKHERGHSWQSLYLGPLYLLAVGIPSAIFNNLWDRLFHKSWKGMMRYSWYYSRYPEKWADRLGGVKRGMI
jgi:hypothetical protein